MRLPPLGRVVEAMINACFGVPWKSSQSNTRIFGACGSTSSSSFVVLAKAFISQWSSTILSFNRAWCSRWTLGTEGRVDSRNNSSSPQPSIHVLMELCGSWRLLCCCCKTSGMFPLCIQIVAKHNEYIQTRNNGRRMSLLFSPLLFSRNRTTTTKTRSL